MKIKNILIFVVFGSITISSMAQFKKFKSETQLQRKEKTSNSKSEFVDTGEDIFGRGKEKLKKKNNSYVNLNIETAFGPEVITSFNFPNTSLQDLTKHMQKLTGINLIVEKDLKGKVSISAPTAITVGDAWKAYLVALNMNGLTLVKSGEFYRIVQARDIKSIPTKIYTGKYIPNTENFIVKIISLKNISSSGVLRSFRPFISRYGRIMEIKQTNTIIVQDTGSNINRLLKLIKFIDVPGHEETLQIIAVTNTSASEIAKLLDKILQKGSSRKFSSTAKKSGGVIIRRVTAEPRTNSIIAMANQSGGRKLKELIKKLDVKLIAANNEQIHVYYLYHGDAKELAKTLSTLVGGSKPRARSRSSRRRLSSSSSNNTLFNAEVRVTADELNNALVITASPTDWLTLKKVIKKLDIIKEQVYVEGLIMETTISKGSNKGVSIIGAYGTGSSDRIGSVLGESGGQLQDLLTNQWTNLGGLFAGIGIGDEKTINSNGVDLKIRPLNALISAIATNGNTNILATPQLLVQDNTEGVFEVGETIPTPEKTNASNGSSTTSIKQQKIALTLKIKPQINKISRFIKMKIDQKIDDFSSRALPSGLQSEGVGTNTRSTVTTVTVRDQDTIAMGGLMRDKEVVTESKVPLLGDIPILGWLFKNNKRTLEKVNMLFFLTPKILSNYQEDVAKVIKDNLNRRAEHLKEVHKNNDPFGTTAKGFYNKAKDQEEGPLYDKKKADDYQKENEMKMKVKNLNEEEDLIINQ